MAECIEREKVEKWLLTESASLDTEVDREYVVERLRSEIPAADVRPVVRGKWKHGVCQTCFFDWSGVAPFASVPNFCPNCGAYMREEEDEP